MGLGNLDYENLKRPETIAIIAAVVLVVSIVVRATHDRNELR
jgi:hypothetical protein